MRLSPWLRESGWYVASLPLALVRRYGWCRWRRIWDSSQSSLYYCKLISCECELDPLQLKTDSRLIVSHCCFNPVLLLSSCTKVGLVQTSFKAIVSKANRSYLHITTIILVAHPGALLTPFLEANLEVALMGVCLWKKINQKLCALYTLFSSSVVLGMLILHL